MQEEQLEEKKARPQGNAPIAAGADSLQSDAVPEANMSVSTVRPAFNQADASLSSSNASSLMSGKAASAAPKTSVGIKLAILAAVFVVGFCWYWVVINAKMTKFQPGVQQEWTLNSNNIMNGGNNTPPHR